MYYLAAQKNNGQEKAGDFGFDMLERIILDECFKEFKKVPPGLVKEKRFCIYEPNPGFKCRDILGLHAEEISSRFGIYVGYDTCFAVVLDRITLETVLDRMWMKVYNTKNWRCSRRPQKHDLFSSVILYDPCLMRGMLSQKKYGTWDHEQDRGLALQVLDKLAYFLRRHAGYDSIIFYSEIFCSRWDASGEIYFGPDGRATNYRPAGDGRAFAYLYNPQVRVWHRV